MVREVSLLECILVHDLSQLNFLEVSLILGLLVFIGKFLEGGLSLLSFLSHSELSLVQALRMLPLELDGYILGTTLEPEASLLFGVFVNVVNITGFGTYLLEKLSIFKFLLTHNGSSSFDLLFLFFKNGQILMFFNL